MTLPFDENQSLKLAGILAHDLVDTIGYAITISAAANRLECHMNTSLRCVGGRPAVPDAQRQPGLSRGNRAVCLHGCALGELEAACEEANSTCRRGGYISFGSGSQNGDPGSFAIPTMEAPMSNKGMKSSLMCIGLAATFGCDAPAHNPTAPTPLAQASGAEVAIANNGSLLGKNNLSGGHAAGTLTFPAVLGGASGRADIHGTAVQNIRDETYSFTAIPTGTSHLATGQVEAHFVNFQGQQFVVHSNVTCVSVVGNQAWVGTRITRFVIDGEDVAQRIGAPMIFRVQDMGEGHDHSDLASLVFFGIPRDGGELAYCNERPAFPILFESGKGNIQVNGG